MSGKKDNGMKNEMNRRNFLKVTAATGAVFFMDGVFNEGAAAMEGLKIEEAEKLVITVITDNYTDALRPHYKIARRPEVKNLRWI
jgi:hypothetical protein